MESSLHVDLEKVSRVANLSLPFLFIGFFWAGYAYSFYFHFLTVTFFFLTALNFYYIHVQKVHTLLSNFGFMAQARYLIESVGPELRQYLFSSDTEERPFTRVERSEVYRKSKGIDSSSAFGSQLDFDGSEYKLRHSLYPVDKKNIIPFSLTFGEERKIAKTYTITKPVILSAMSYGALGSSAVQSLARGVKQGGIPMNTGEGGYPKYHLISGCELIFQMGTAKFGVRNEDSSLNEEKLRALSQKEQIKMIEIKLSQGAKPGKGGLLPKEKITKEISELRGVPLGKDVISPPHHIECTDAKTTVQFIRHVQDVSELPVGIKLCFGREDEFRHLIHTMKELSIFPDYISIDGAEGGTGAAPRSFMDDIGVPLFQALPKVHQILKEEGVRDKLKLLCAGKLINPGRQFIALSLGADACYTARGFMLALGCIQALQCNQNTCPVGITTHSSRLQKGIDIEFKADRIQNYIYQMNHDYYELLASMGKKSFYELDESNILFPFHH
jgi:glutamate synthase domain-containing protein 2